jgi:hypothetical protein
MFGVTFDWFRFNKYQHDNRVLSWFRGGGGYEGQPRSRANVYTACMTRGQGTDLRKCGK